MLQEPVKLLKKEQFVLLCYTLWRVEGVIIYIQVMLVSNKHGEKLVILKNEGI